MQGTKETEEKTVIDAIHLMNLSDALQANGKPCYSYGGKPISLEQKLAQIRRNEEVKNKS